MGNLRLCGIIPPIPNNNIFIIHVVGVSVDYFCQNKRHRERGHGHIVVSVFLYKCGYL